MLIPHTDNSVWLSLFPYFFEQPYVYPSFYIFLNVIFYFFNFYNSFPYFFQSNRTELDPSTNEHP